MPGLRTASDELVRKTAKLPATELTPPTHAIGRRTEDCIRAGVLWGTADAVDGLVRRIKAEWPSKMRPMVVGTGGLAGLVAAVVPRNRIGSSRSDIGRPADRGEGTRSRVVTDARTLNAWRRWGYRVLPGDLYSYILHMRPAEWPIMAGHTLLGYVLAVGVAGVVRGEHIGSALLALVIWVVFLNGGTLAINSVFDKDEGDIGYLNSRRRCRAICCSSVGDCSRRGRHSRFCSRSDSASRTRSVSSFRSCIPFRRFVSRRFAGVDWVINMWGFGSLTPYAAWAATGRPLDAGHGLVLLAFCPLFAGLYPLTQLYQFDEDRRRGDRTLALILGMRASLVVATLCTLLAFGLLAWAAIMLKADGRWLIAPLVLWLAVLLPWLSGHAAWSPKQHQRGMYRALAAWAVTDLTVLYVFAT